MKKFIAVIALSLFSFAALADQCAYITKEQAKEGAQLIKESEKIQSFCEPCGDTTPTTLDVTDVKVAFTNYENYYEVQINGMGIDLAYTYAEGLNLAKLVGCPASGVSDEI